MRDDIVVATGWQKKVLDAVSPIIQGFAQEHNGTVQTLGSEVDIRVLHNGYITIQIAARGKLDDCKLEVSGVGRNGIETARTVFQLKHPDLTVDLQAFQVSLDKTLSR